MAQFFKPSKTRKAAAALRQQTVIGLDHHLQGVVRYGKDVFFVSGALPEESIDLLPQAKSHQAKLLKRHSAADFRIEPACPHYSVCGGCSSQHLDAKQQLLFKAQGVVSLLDRLAGFRYHTAPILLADRAWAYRRSARLSSLYSENAGWQLGFRQKASKQIASIDSCAVLQPGLSALLPALQQLVRKWPKNSGLGHIDLLEAEQGLALRFRFCKQLSDKRRLALHNWAASKQLLMSISDGDESSELRFSYVLPEQQIRLHFHLGDFIQVNESLNQQMIALALRWLDLSSDDKVLDLYAGVGNFSLPIAQQVASVIAVEGVKRMAEQISENANANLLSNIQAFAGDLEQATTWQQWSNSGITKVLLDPARAGAKHAITQVAKLKPSHIVYVSCNPATLARDAAILKQAGYLLTQLAVVDMFSQTEHVETMALFEKK